MATKSFVDAANIEEIGDLINNKRSPDPSKNIDVFGEYSNDRSVATKQRHVAAGFDGDDDLKIRGAYNAASETISNEFKNNQEIDLEKQETKDSVKKVLLSYMEESISSYFPGFMERIRKLNVSEKEKYDNLVAFFDREFANNGQPTVDSRGQRLEPATLDGLEERIKDSFKDAEGNVKKISADMLRGLIRGLIPGHKAVSESKRDSQAINAYIADLPHGVYADNLIEKMDKMGFTIEDSKRLELYTKSNLELAQQLHHPIIRGTAVDYAALGFKPRVSAN